MKETTTNILPTPCTITYYQKTYPLDSFIGCVSNKEAGEMKDEIMVWKQRFNDDIDKRQKTWKEIEIIKRKNNSIRNRR